MNYYRFGTKIADAYGLDWLVADSDVLVYDSVVSPDQTESIVKTVEISASGATSNQTEYDAWA